MNFVKQPRKSIRCTPKMKAQSKIYMNEVVKFVEPYPALPILKEYFVK